jgi:hypothetical protein
MHLVAIGGVEREVVEPGRQEVMGRGVAVFGR